MVAGSGSLHDGVDDLAVGELDGRSREVRHELFGDAAGELFRVGEDELLELIHVLEGAAIGHGETRVHGAALGVEADVGAGYVHDLVLGAVRDGAVNGAPAAGDVVVLQGEAGRVELGMATGAGGLVAVLVELLADRRGSADVRLDGGHVFRRRIGRGAEDAVEHVSAAHHGRGAGAVGGDFQDRALRDEAAAPGVGGEADLADPAALDAGDAVVLGEAFVEHGEVAVQDVPHAEVVPEQFLEEVLRLGDHGLLQVLLELGVELGVGLGEVDVAEVEPATEQVAGEARRLGRSEEALGLGSQHGRVMQFPLRGERGQFVIGRGAPKAVAETGGERVIVETSGLFLEEEEVRRAQRHLVGGAQGVIEATAPGHLLLHEREMLAHLVLAHGTAEGLRQKRGEEAAGVGLGLRGGHSQVLARRFRIGGLQRQVAVEQTVARRRPLLMKRAFDFHPLDDRTDACDHRSLVRLLRHGAIGREPERLALRHARLVGELAELGRTHLEVGVAKGQSGARPVGERHLEDDMAVGTRGVVLAGVGAGLVDHRPCANAEAVARIRHRRRPRAEFAVRTVGSVPADGEQALGRMRPLAVLEARCVPVVPRFVVVRADLLGLGLGCGDGRFFERKVSGL